MTGRLREFLRRLMMLIRRRTSNHEWEDEISAHIEMATEDNLRGGMHPEEARRLAMVKFGSRGSAHEIIRDQAGLPALESLISDVRYAFRGMRKNPGFTSVVIITLALGIGANTALFGLVESVMLRNLPVRDPGQLYFLVNAGSAGPNGAPPYPCYEQFRDRAKSFTGMAAFAPENLTIAIDGSLEQVPGEYASGSYFNLLGVRPAIGRVLNAADEKLQPPAAVLNYAYWRRRFGGDPGVIGKTISHEGRPLTIVGVADSRFQGLTPGRPADITVPFTLQPASLLSSGNWWFEIVARLKPGVVPSNARAEIDPIFQSYMNTLADLVQSVRHEAFDHMELIPAANGRDLLRRQFSKPLLVLMAISGLVLLIGCANLANLFMAKASARRREFAVRLAIGAGRGRLVRQLAAETLLLFGCGACCGLGLAFLGSQIMAEALAIGRTPFLLDSHLNASVLAFTAGITLLTGLIFGVAPVLGAVRSDPYPALKSSGTRTGDSRGRIRLRQLLVAAQVALSMILLVGAGLFVRTFANLDRLELGFRPEHVLTLSVSPVGPSYSNAQLDSLWSRVLERVRAIPAIQSAGLAWLTPLSGRDREVVIAVPGSPAGNLRDHIIGENTVSDGYFETLGIPVIAGREFTAADRPGAPQVAILNEAAVRAYFGGRNPVGMRVELPRPTGIQSYEIAGVVRDTKHLSLRIDAPRFIYLSSRQPRRPQQRLTLAVKTRIDPSKVAATLEREVRSVGPDILVTEVTTMQKQVDAALLQERLLSTLSGFFSVLALLLSAAGLYGLLAHIVEQGTNEIGIRIALGADAAAVVWMILRRSLWLVAAGVGVGIPAALLAARPLASLLYGLQATDGFTVCAGVFILTATALFATYIPARRAARIDPHTALRWE